MSRAIDVAIVVVITVIVIEAALFSLPASGSTVHFGFPTSQQVNQLLTGETIQSSYSMQNSTSLNMSGEYGLVKSQSASYSSSNVSSVNPSVYLTELKFNSLNNASGFYSSQLFGSILTSKLPVLSSNLNISYGGAVYSIFAIGSISQGYSYIIGHYGNFAFALFLYSAQPPQATLTGLTELVVQSMK